MNGKLLVADDDGAVRLFVARSFEGYGYACDTVDGVGPAMELLGGSEYDVLLADKNMPGTDGGNEGGMELIRWARTHHPDVAVLMMTGFATVESAVEALKLGAFDYLQKPIDAAELRRKVDRLREYRTFINPQAVIDLHLSLFRDILDTAGSVAPETGHKLDMLKERLDALFHALKVLEQTAIEQRHRLAEIAAFAERSRDSLPPGDPARDLLEHVCQEASHRI